MLPLVGNGNDTKNQGQRAGLAYSGFKGNGQDLHILDSRAPSSAYSGFKGSKQCMFWY